MTGYVYAIANGRGAVKIGWSRDPVRRLAEVNVLSEASYRLLGFASGTKDHEKVLHGVLVEGRIRGEWFDAEHPVVRLFLDMLPPARPWMIEEAGRFSLRPFLERNRGMAKAIADRIGVTHQAITQWQTVPASRVIAVSEITGVPPHQLRPDLYLVEAS